MDIRFKDGWIEVICGSMFAGKTEELIRRVNRIKFAKKDVLVFKPMIDNRYDAVQVVSHENKRINACPVNNSGEALKQIEKYGHLPYAVAFDEAQFFDRGLVDLCDRLANSGVRVICAGLDTDFRGEPFGIMGDLLCKAEDVTKLHAICMVCGSTASRTQRLVNSRPANFDEPTILVGAKEQYEARCRHCHQVNGKEKAKENL
jgi:thymidine kinase